MTSPLAAHRLEALSTVARDRGARWLALHGSRARGDHRPDSDWDFAYAGEHTDALGLMGDLVQVLDTDRVDLSRSPTASILFQHRVVSNGVLIYEDLPGIWLDYKVEVSIRWCDMEPVLTRAYAAQVQAWRDHGS
ncbi:MAG: nucleotidyltransferase domain-containing protein [Myxococcota bacterium]